MTFASPRPARRLPSRFGIPAAIVAALLAAADASGASPQVSLAAVSFPAYDVGSQGETRGAGGVTLLCDTDCPGAYQLTLGTSLNGGGTAQRRMKHAASERFLEYTLALESGDGSWADSVTRAVSPGVSLAVRVSGIIAPLQNVPAGFFSDSVTVTVEW